MAEGRYRYMFLAFLGLALLVSGIVLAANYTNESASGISIGSGADAYTGTIEGVRQNSYPPPGSGDPGETPTYPSTDVPRGDTYIPPAGEQPVPAPPDGPTPDPLSDLFVVWHDRPDADGFVPGNGSGPISGRVTDPWGNGLPGISVYLDGMFPDEPWFGPKSPDAVTDSDGYYSINRGYGARILFDGQVYGMHASEYYDDTDSRGAIHVPPGSSGVDAVLVPDGSLAGRINGADAREYSVTAYRLGDGGPWLGLETVIGREGFTMQLEPGLYKLLVQPEYEAAAVGTAQATWFGGATDMEHAAIIRIEPGQTVSINVNMLPAGSTPERSVSGRLFLTQVSGIEAPERVTLSLIDASDPDMVIASQDLPTRAPGSFRFDDIPDGSYKLKCSVDGSAGGGWFINWSWIKYGTNDRFDWATVINVSDTNPLHYVDFYAQLQGGSVSGKVFSADGRPVNEGLVRAIRVTGGSEPAATGVVYEAILYRYEYGRYDFHGRLQPGTYRMCYTPGGGGEFGEYCRPDTVTLDWFESVGGFDLTLPDIPVSITGRVYAPDGTPANVESVHLVAGSSVTVKATTSSDADGNYRIDYSSSNNSYGVCAIVRDLTTRNTSRYCHYVDENGDLAPSIWPTMFTISAGETRNGIDIMTSQDFARADGVAYKPPENTVTIRSKPNTVQKADAGITSDEASDAGENLSGETGREGSDTNPPEDPVEEEPAGGSPIEPPDKDEPSEPGEPVGVEAVAPDTSAVLPPETEVAVADDG